MSFMRIKLIYNICLFTIFLILASDILNSYHKYQNIVFDMDSYILYESAKELYVSGVAKIGFWVNSSTGLDLVAWGHYLPAYYYLIMIAIDSSPNTIYLYQIFEKIVLLLLVYTFMVQFAKHKKLALILTVFVLLDPLYSWFVLYKQYTRWPLIFGYLSILLIMKLLRGDDVPHKLYSFFVSFILVMVVGAHASIGVPISISIIIFLVLEKVNMRAQNLSILHFFFGLLLGLVFLLIPVYINMNPNDMKGLFNILLSYVHKMSIGDGLYNLILQRLFFISNIFVPVQNTSILGAITILLSISIKNYQIINDQEKAIVRLSVIIFITSCFLGMVSPIHFTAVRMVWLMPMIIILSFIIINKTNNLIVVCGVLLTFIVSLSYQFIKNHVSIYILALFAVFTLIGLLFIYKAHNKCCMPNSKYLLIFVYSSFLFLLVNNPTIYKVILNIESGIKLSGPELEPEEMKTTQLSKVGNLPNYNLLMKSVILDINSSDIVKNLKSRDWVLTNYPISDFFEKEKNIQIIRNHRGFMQGAREKACDYMYIVGKQSLDQLITVNSSESVDINVAKIKYIYYRGHTYGNLVTSKILNNYVSIIGVPVETSKIDVKNDEIVSLDTITKESFLDYISYRKKNNLGI